MKHEAINHRHEIREPCYAHVRFLHQDVLGYVRDITHDGAKIVFVDKVDQACEIPMPVEIIPIPETELQPFCASLTFHWRQFEEPFWVYGASTIADSSEADAALTDLVKYFESTVGGRDAT